MRSNSSIEDLIKLDDAALSAELNVDAESLKAIASSVSKECQASEIRLTINLPCFESYTEWCEDQKNDEENYDLDESSYETYASYLKKAKDGEAIRAQIKHFIVQYKNLIELKKARELALQTIAKAKELGIQVKGNLANDMWLQKAATLSDLKNQTSLLQRKIDNLGKLAIDRTDFDSQDERLNEIIDDLNAGKMPVARYVELLLQNKFEKEESVNYATQERFTNITGLSFIAYAAPKLKPEVLKSFLSALKATLGEKQFDMYMALPIAMGELGGELTYTILRHYFANSYNETRPNEKANHLKRKEIVAKYTDPNIANTQSNVNFDRVDTHTSSVHLSADVSHVGGFKRMLELVNIEGLQVKYSNFTKAVKDQKEKTESPRKIAIQQNTNLDKFIATQLTELQNEIKHTEDLTKDKLYNKFVAAGNNDIFQETNQDHINKVNFFIFQLQAASRFVDEMIETHTCGHKQGSTYKYKTTENATCGLTMEQMVAATYYLGKKDVEEGVESFYPLIKALYDMRRGYNIDDGDDKPEDYKRPANLGTDHNRCHGGCVNSLVDALYTLHTLYDRRLLNAQTIQLELKKIYNEIAAKNVDTLQKEMLPEEICVWSSTGIVTGAGKDVLDAVFKVSYEPEFRSVYAGYLADSVFEGIILEATSNVTIPAALKQVHSIDSMSKDALKQAILNNQIPLLHYDDENGHQPTISYLLSKQENKGLIKDILDAAQKEPINYDA